ncbi:Hypothetical predicted protein [Xyrichtys novacula]|uniref:Uncharacterized protein n=1 Tax=Xyrichtys novacula TaxID=13765 RepID=A0AAV1GGZ6_XYRNO|nr:Hypothetical predicted protein [Xyrichtys novacula]
MFRVVKTVTVPGSGSDKSSTTPPAVIHHIPDSTSPAQSDGQPISESSNTGLPVLTNHYDSFSFGSAQFRASLTIHK